MLPAVSPLRRLREGLRDGTLTAAAVAHACAARANASASRNTYVGFDAEEVIAQAGGLDGGGALFGVPVSIKDLFDVEGTVTGAGTKYYAEHTRPAATDSAVAARVRATGALITGKTHLHPLAYGITGENADYGDCVQPRDSTRLTGGSSSGAAASVQEGSAVAAIGTDTGGSVRIPAALCGLVGYRASHALPMVWPELWRGGMHLAASFDTIGFLVEDPRDAATMAEALLGIRAVPAGGKTVRIGCVAESFVAGAEAEVVEGFRAWKEFLAASGAVVEEFEPVGWGSAGEIYAGIVAHEAAGVHRRHGAGLLGTIDPAIAQRMRGAEALTEPDVDSLRGRHLHFRAAIAGVLARFDFLLMPSAPVTKLVAGEDQTAARVAILRYTTPFSLAGLPVLTLPGELVGAGFGTGVQLAAAQMEDGALLGYGARLADAYEREPAAAPLTH